MPSHFRPAVLAIVLAGGTLASYMAAYAVMGAAPATASTGTEMAAVARALPASQTDISIKEACAAFRSAAARTRCSQEIAAPARAVRVIDFASAETGTAVR